MADDVHRSAYRFFGRRIVVESDAAGVIAALDAVYERQRAAPDDGSPEPGAPDILVSVRSGGPAGPRIAFGGRTVRVPDADQLVHFAHLVLVNAAAAQSGGTLVLHGGAVARDGRALLLVGASGMGKSTLTLELVRRGWRLLSDDFAVVAPDGVVEPFPRRVNLTDASLALLGLAVPEGGLKLVGFNGRAKWMIDGDALFPGRLGGPAPLGSIFVLAPAADGSEPDGGRTTVWRLQLDHVPPTLVARLAALPGVRSATAGEPGAGARVVTLLAEPGARVVAALDALCAASDVSILAARRGEGAAPAFAGRPAAAPLDALEAVPRLLAHALGLSGRRFVAGTDRAGVLDELARVRGALAASAARVFQLVPGELAATADLVERLAPGDDTPVRLSRPP